MRFDLSLTRKGDTLSGYKENEMATQWFFNYDCPESQQVDDLTTSEKEDIRKFYSNETTKHKSSLDELLKKFSD